MDASSFRTRLASPRWWFWLVFTAVLSVVAVQYTVKAAEERSAFVRWRNQLHDLGKGEDIYQLHVYPNAPMMAILLYPLSLLPRLSILGFGFDLGAFSWFVLKVAMTVQACIWIRRMLALGGQPFPAWAQLLALLLGVRPIIGDLMHGNVNLLILFLVIGCLYAFTRGQDFLAGVVLALSITCKVTPALFLPYFLWKRAWKTLAGCSVGLLLFFFVIPGSLLGHGHNWKLLNSWAERMILPYVQEGAVWTEHSNQSLPALIHRLTTDSPSFLDEEDRPKEFHNLLSLDPATARLVVKGCGLGFLVLMCWSCRTPTAPRGGWRLSAEFSIVVLGMLLFSERTWKHHCVTLLLPFATLCYYLATQRSTRGWCWYLVGSMAVAQLLMAATSTSLWQPFGYRLGAKMAQVYGAYTWAELILLAALVSILVEHLEHRTRHAKEHQAEPAATVSR